MEKSYQNLPWIIRLGLFDVVRGVKMETDKKGDDKIITPMEVAKVFAEEEIERLMKDYRCLEETPRQITEKINEEVIGQEDVVEKLVHVAYFNQMANLLDELGLDAPKRTNLLLIGPTGCGKTSSINALKRYFNVPIIKYSADSITSAGYIGNKVEQTTSAGKDINGRAVQEELLKILEPNQIDLTLHDKTRVPFDTTKLTVILGGAFVGLSDIRKKRLCKNSVGFKSNTKEITKEEMMKAGYIPQDLISFGFIPEIVGRIFMYAELRELTPDDIVKIMFEGKNSPYIEKTRFLANVLNVEQQISKKFLKNVAEKLASTETYARDLEAKMTLIFYPLIQIAFEHSNEYGICEIFEDGEYSITYDDITYYGNVSV